MTPLTFVFLVKVKVLVPVDMVQRVGLATDDLWCLVSTPQWQSQ